MSCAAPPQSPCPPAAAVASVAAASPNPNLATPHTTNLEEEALRRLRNDTAWKLVERITALCHERYRNTQLEQLHADDIFFLAKAFLKCQQQFRKELKPVSATVAFHYTRPECVASIRQDGLLSSGGKGKFRHGNSFGDGVYVANNPHAFKVYGKIGLVVLILKGEVSQKTSYGGKDGKDSNDSWQGNKLMKHGDTSTTLPISPYFDEIILRRSQQVLPLISYPSNTVKNNESLMWDLQVQIQQLADQLLNEGRSTLLKKIQPTKEDKEYEESLNTKFQLNRASRGVFSFGLPNPNPNHSHQHNQQQQQQQKQPPSFFKTSTPPITFPLVNNQQQQTTFSFATTKPAPLNPFAAPAAAPNNHFFGGPPPPQNPPFPFGALAPPSATTFSFGCTKQPPASRASSRASGRRKVVECPGPRDNPGASLKGVYSPTSFGVPSEDCPVCFVALNDGQPAVCLNKCSHCFHEQCLVESLKRSSKCPICRVAVGGEPVGNGPKGTMTVEQDHFPCAGYEKYGSFIITYNIPRGIQSSCHDNPGQPYSSTVRTAYLPNNSEGRALCKRLRYAFSRGLLFNVGTSLTTGRSNVVIWGSVHHKTSRSGGAHGWPDPGHFLNANEELDSCGVPKSSDL